MCEGSTGLFGTGLKPGDWAPNLLQSGGKLSRFGRPTSKVSDAVHFLSLPYT